MKVYVVSCFEYGVGALSVHVNREDAEQACSEWDDPYYGVEEFELHQ